MLRGTGPDAGPDQRPGCRPDAGSTPAVHGSPKTGTQRRPQQGTADGPLIDAVRLAAYLMLGKLPAGLIIRLEHLERLVRRRHDPD
jgi:hypothetical protein